MLLKNMRSVGRILPDNAKKTAYAAWHLTEENKKRPNEQKLSILAIIKTLQISRATYYRYLDFAKNSLIEMSAKEVWKNKMNK